MQLFSASNDFYDLKRKINVRQIDQNSSKRTMILLKTILASEKIILRIYSAK